MKKLLYGLNSCLLIGALFSGWNVYFWGFVGGVLVLELLIWLLVRLCGERSLNEAYRDEQRLEDYPQQLPPKQVLDQLFSRREEDTAHKN